MPWATYSNNKPSFAPLPDIGGGLQGSNTKISMKADIIKALSNMQEFLTYNANPKELAEAINAVCAKVEADTPEMQSNIDKLQSLASTLTR